MSASTATHWLRELAPATEWVILLEAESGEASASSLPGAPGWMVLGALVMALQGERVAGQSSKWPLSNKLKGETMGSTESNAPFPYINTVNRKQKDDKREVRGATV